MGDPPSRIAVIAKANGWIAGLVVLTLAGIGIGILFVWRPPQLVVDREAVERAAVDRAAVERAATEGALAQREAVARAEAERQRQAEFTAFRKAMLLWAKDARAVTMLLRAAPSPPILHQRIRDAKEAFDKAGNLAFPHLVNTPDGQVAKDKDVIGILWARASGMRTQFEASEKLAELYMTTMRLGGFKLAALTAEMVSQIGSILDDRLDAIEDLIRRESAPTVQEIETRLADTEDVPERILKVLDKAKGN